MNQNSSTSDHTMKLNYALAGMLLMYSFLVLFRSPQLIFHPRFWCEEGLSYFQYAWHHGVWDSLLIPHQGYFSLISNLSTLIASRIVPLEYAPIITTFCAFLIQLIPAILILYSPISAFEKMTDKTIALLILIFTIPSAEVWLNTINSQFHLLLAVMLILISEPRSKWMQLFHFFIIGITGLSTPLIVFALPFFCIRIYQKVSSSTISQFILVLLGTIIQLYVIQEFPLQGERHAPVDGQLFLFSMTCKCISLPLMGMDFTQRLGDIFTYYIDHRYVPLTVNISLVLIICGGIVFLWNSRVKEARWLLVAGLLILILSFESALNSSRSNFAKMVLVGGRYFYVPNVLFALTLFMSIRGCSVYSRVTRNMGMILLMWLLLSGANHVLFKNGYNNFLLQGPDWRDEVRLWREDPTHSLQIWFDGMEMNLDAPPDSTKSESVLHE